MYTRPVRQLDGAHGCGHAGDLYHAECDVRVHSGAGSFSVGGIPMPTGSEPLQYQGQPSQYDKEDKEGEFDSENPDSDEESDYGESQPDMPLPEESDFLDQPCESDENIQESTSTFDYDQAAKNITKSEALTEILRQFCDDHLKQNLHDLIEENALQDTLLAADDSNHIKECSTVGLGASISRQAYNIDRSVFFSFSLNFYSFAS